MKTNARYSFVLTLVLGPIGGCGDDSNKADDVVDTGSTSEGASSSTGEEPDATSSTSSSSGSESGNADGSSGGDDPFADCTRGVLAQDFGVVDTRGNPGAPRWYGPGADEDGALIDDGESEYTVSVTYLALSLDADLAFFGELNMANAMALYTNPGMVAVQLGGSAQCGSARTFTVWESEEAMMEFVMSDAHLQSVGSISALSRGGTALSVWPEAVPASEINWKSALERLAEAETYD
ncbi:MAG: hypothetical protein KUG77_00870 [Nannocystaceae bacterium]|nr:hypothetical protein [Nannocystaceae bacterium]